MEQVHDVPADAAKQADAQVEELAALIASVFRFEGDELRELAAALYQPVA